VIFTTLTVGVNITKHYSDGELYSFSVYGEAKSCCEVPCDCCSDESEFFQLQGDYLFSGYTLHTEVEAIDLLLSTLPTIDIVSTSSNQEFDIFHNTDSPLHESKDYLSMIQAFLL
jgi:hypothetical protein